jgi:hypothetical protein
MQHPRVRFACMVISWGIKFMPKEWRTKQAIDNLMSSNIIQNIEK